MHSSQRRIGKTTSTKSLFRIVSGLLYTEYRVLGFRAATRLEYMSVQVVFNEVILNPTDEYFAELERLKINVAPKSRDQDDYQDDYQVLVGTQHIDERMVLSMRVCMGYIM